MTIFKRGRVYWYHFYFSGQHIQKSTKQGNPRVARQIEAAFRTALAKGEVGILDWKTIPTLHQFSQRFMDAISVRCTTKPNTVRVLCKEDEAVASQPLRDVAMLILDTGVRVGEAVALEWHDVHLNPINGARLGFLHIKSGKFKNVKRNLPLTRRVREMLTGRLQGARQKSAGNPTPPSVFTSHGEQISVDYLDRAHFQLRAVLGLPRDFVLHSLRHTRLTRLGESGVDAFTIMRIAGHSTIIISQRYVPPSSEAVETAFERLDLEALNDTVAERAVELEKRRLLATVSATSQSALVSTEAPMLQQVIQ